MSDTNASEVTTVSVERQSPEAVFALLGDDIRMGIVRALGETPDEVVGFAELRERVGVRDSGQFNYHLGKLRGSFVRKTDDPARDDGSRGSVGGSTGGYELTYAGRQVIGAMHAGTYTANATVEPFPVDGTCPLCESAVVASYADETATVECTACDEWENTLGFPPGSLDQFEREELPGAFDRWLQYTMSGIVAGFCYTCAGRMTGQLVVDEDEQDHIAGVPARVTYECDRCGSHARASGFMPVLYHPGVQGFLFDHGFDVRADPSWNLVSFAPPAAELTAEDPPELRVSFTVDDEEVVATVTADATVTDVTRRPA
jgi:hypothetical protein